MYGTTGDAVLGDRQLLLVPATATITAAGSAAHVSFSLATDAAEPEHFRLEFAAPPGRQLEAGRNYVRAQRVTLREPGRPGVLVANDTHACVEPTTSGSFEVRDLAVGPDGNVRRAWIVYEISCNGSTPLTGEIRYGMP